MNRTPSDIWRNDTPDLKKRLSWCFETSMEMTEADPVIIHFRADDVGVPSRTFTALAEVFQKHRIPLSLAVVPTWLGRSRWSDLAALTAGSPDLWCWHQHGWRHQNHEPEGKKEEFGRSRPAGEIEADLVRGRDRLHGLMGDRFFPAFTPPWNRCGVDALRLLEALGYRAVSRSQGSRPPSPVGLPEFSVNVDLHTRKDKGPDEGWRRLFAEFGHALTGGYCGVMIHHQRMNRAAVDFLDLLLAEITRCKRCRAVHLGDLAVAAKDG